MTLVLVLLGSLGAWLLRRRGRVGAGGSPLRLGAAAALAGALLGGVGNYTMPVMAGVLFVAMAVLVGVGRDRDPDAAGA
jgi:energy-converting hydrogenase Eha subunit B